MKVFVVVFGPHAPQARVGHDRPAVAAARIDRAGDGKIHRRNVLDRGVRQRGRHVQLVVRRLLETEQQIVAENEAHPARDVVHRRSRSLEVRVVADQQQAAALLDESLHGLDLRLAVPRRRDLDDEHVALAQRLVVNLVLLQQPRHLIILPQVVVHGGVIVARVFAEPRGVVGSGGGFPGGVTLHDHHSAIPAGADRVPADRRREQGDGQGE